MQNKKTNGYDETKKMLNILRGLNSSSSRSINEQFDSQTQQVDDKPEHDDITVINDVDVKLISSDMADMELSEEQKNAISNIVDSFRDQVSQIADFEPGFTLTKTQIRLDGTLPDQDIRFVLIAGEQSGFYVNADMLEIDEQTILILERLQKFILTFKDALDPLIRERQNN